MRVISGTSKGRKLIGPKTDKIRPALDKVKESIFNILYDVKDLKILDMFAGTGSIGIEALSRGAREVVFIDDFAHAISIINKNLSLCGFTDRAKIIQAKALKGIGLLERKKKIFDIIFVDPPYLKNYVNPTLNILAKSSIINNDTYIIIEHHPKEPVISNDFIVTDQRTYGQTLISFLKKSPD